MKHLKYLLVAYMALTGSVGLSNELSLSIDLGVRTSQEMGLEERLDPSMGAYVEWKPNDLHVEASVVYTNTKKFFLDAGADDHSVNADYALLYAPGNKGFLFGGGARHASLTTSQWDKVRTGGLVKLGWRWSDSRITLLGYLPDEQDAQGFGLEYKYHQHDREWLPGWTSRIDMIEHSSRGVDYRGLLVTFRLAIYNR